jgi:hypothetical protein
MVALCEGSYYVAGYPLERGTNIVLMHLALIPGSGLRLTAEVSLPAPLLNIVSLLEPEVPYSGFCWHSSDLLTVRHVIRPARRSLCYEGKLPRLFLIDSRQIPNGALVCHSSQRGIFIGPSSFCTWSCGRQYLSILTVSGLYFLKNGPNVLVVQLFCFQSRWIPAGCSYNCYSSYLLDVCPRLDFVAVGTLFFACSSRKGIGIVVFSGLAVLGSEAVLLQALNLAGGLSLEVLKTHNRGNFSRSCSESYCSKL